jgi:hypothetical protein
MLSCRTSADRSPSQGSSRSLARGRNRANLVRLGCSQRDLLSRLLFGCLTVLGAAGSAMPAEVEPPQVRALHVHPLQDAVDWRERMQKNHNVDRSIEQQVRRLTKDLDLTPEQQEKVRQLSKQHNDSIQKILDTAPPTLTHEAFTTQVHAISQEFHDAVNAILTPPELELMKAMVGRLDSGKEDRHAP